MRFLHLADVHLDTPFASRAATVRKRLREASREAFGRALQTALDEGVDAVLIAGDLFDGQRLSFETERFLARQLERLRERAIPVVYATGNHDPGRERGRLAGLEWPSNVIRVAEAVPRRLAVRDAEGNVVGHVTAAGHESSAETRDLSRAFPRPTGSRPEVALLHARVVGSRDEGEHDPYAPAELDHLRSAGYHYWALGHVHTRQELGHEPAIHYPGNLQGRTPAESGPRGGLLAEVAPDGSVEVEFRAFAPVRWETVTLGALEECTTFDRLVEAVGRAWERAREHDPVPGAEWMVRVVLQGGCPLWETLARPDERGTLALELAERLPALEVEVWADAVHAPVDTSGYRDRRDVLGEALRRLGAVRRGEIPIPDGLEGELAGWGADGGTTIDEYVAELLSDAEGELLARMLDRPPPGRE